MRELVMLLAILAVERESTKHFVTSRTPPAPSKSMPAPGRATINVDQATKLAELYVREHGYTNRAKPLRSLRPRVYGFFRRSGGLLIGFEWTEPFADEPSAGAAVFVGDDGREVGMSDMGFDLKIFTARPN